MGDKRTSRRPEIEAELQALENEYDDLLREALAWETYIGSRPVKVFAGPQQLFRLFVGFHIFTGAVGALLILTTSGRVSDLGIALLVGALFGLGAFLAEIWVQSMDRWHRFAGGIRESRHRVRVEQIVARSEALVAELDDTA